MNWGIMRGVYANSRTMICAHLCCDVTLAWWYVHVSDLSLRAAIHALQSSIDFFFLSRDSPTPDLSHIDICIYAFILLQSCIICTALRPRLFSFFPLMYQPQGIRSPGLFLLPFMYHIHGLRWFISWLCIMSSIHHIMREYIGRSDVRAI